MHDDRRMDKVDGIAVAREEAGQRPAAFQETAKQEDEAEAEAAISARASGIAGA